MVQVYTYHQKPFLQFTTWHKYQRTRATKSKYPEPPANTCRQLTSNVPVSECEKREARDESAAALDGAAAPTDPRKKRGEFGWVKLTDAEHQRLIAEFGADVVGFYVRYVDESAQQTGNKNRWKDWNLTVRKAIRNKWGGEPSHPQRRELRVLE
jgi:hypothetical protein